MKKLMIIVAMVGVIATGLEQATAVNIAIGETGIIGTTDDASTSSDPIFSWPSSNIVDGDLNSLPASPTYWDIMQTDGHAAAVVGDEHYVGVTFGSPVSDINQIVIYHRTFSNGGWFGGADATPVEPVVQTLNGGSWSDVAGMTSDYTTAISPSVANPSWTDEPPATFAFSALGAVDGIRLIGLTAITAKEFLSVREFEVYVAPPVVVPEPAGLGLIGLALLAVRKRRS